jgi:DNA-binding transcriptional ArsR family regulator
MVTHQQEQRVGGRRDRVYSAVADATRRSILAGLARGPRSAGEIARDYDVSRPAISKHLRALETAELVRVEKRGRRRVYALNPAPLGEIDRWLEEIRTMWAARLVGIKRAAEDDAREESER